MATTPFGIELGSPVSSLSVIEELGQGKYFVTAPRPHPQFATYVVQASPMHGVVWIKGLGSEILNDGYGNMARAEVDKVIAQLESRYGPGSKVDMGFHDSIWEEARDWTMALHQNERLYHCVWNRGEARGLPDDLSTIFVGASANDSSTTNVAIEYASLRFEDAERELESANADLL